MFLLYRDVSRVLLTLSGVIFAVVAIAKVDK